MSSANEVKQPVDTGDSRAGTTSSTNPFDQVRHETFGSPSARRNGDDGGNSPGNDADTRVQSGVKQEGAKTANSQTGETTRSAEPQRGQYLDMETGQIVSGNAQENTQASTGSATASEVGVNGQEAGKDPKADASGSKKTETSEEDPDFAILTKGKPEEQKADTLDELTKKLIKDSESSPEKTPGQEKPKVDEAKPKPEKVDDAAKKKTPDLPHYKPDPSRNRRHDTSMEKMTGWLNKNFDKLDTDKNGTITQEELGKHMENPALANGEGGIYLATAYGAAKDWNKVANELSGKKSDAKESKPDAKDSEEASDPNVGITKEGIKAVRDNLDKFDSKELKDRYAIKSLTTDFPELDTNKDKTITMAELDTALKQEGLGKEQREKLETLKKNFKEVAGTTDDVIKRKWDSGQDAEPEIQKPTLDGKPLKDVEFISEHDLNSFKGSEAISLQKSLENHTKHLSSDQEVSQGQTGSCFVLAPVAAILDKDPTFFDDKIKDMGDGKLQVKLPDNEGRYGTVDTVISKPTDAERARFGGGETAAIIEKAFGQHLKDLYASKKPGAVQDQIHDGGSESSAIRALTGNDTKRTSPQEAEEKVRAVLSLAGDKDTALTAGTNPEVTPGSGLMHKHVYQVSGFDKATGEVELTNPHKGDFGGEIEPMKNGVPRDGKLDGKFKISLAEFRQNFAEINSFDIRKK